MEKKIKDSNEIQKKILELEQEKLHDGMTVAQLFGKLEHLRALYDQYHNNFVEIAKEVKKEKEKEVKFKRNCDTKISTPSESKTIL